MAIQEFNDLGRYRFLKKYGFSRSSKFYLIHDQRIYDTKALVGAAYLHATGRKLTSDKFSGGAQTEAVFRRIKKQETCFVNYKVFEDTLGELSNLSGEFDRLPRAQSDLRKLGFSKWILLRQYNELHMDATRIAKLRAQGRSWRAIATQLDVGLATLHRQAVPRSKIQERDFGTP
jgi:hypothetical protein